MTEERKPYLALRGFKVYFERRRGLVAALRRSAPEPVRAVDGIDATIGKGEIYCLVGESGCGKTTTGMGILRLVEPTAGDVFVDLPQDIFEEYERARARGDERMLEYIRKRHSLIFEQKFVPTRRNYQLLLLQFLSAAYLGLLLPAVAIAFQAQPFANPAVDILWGMAVGAIVGFFGTFFIPRMPVWGQNTLGALGLVAAALGATLAMLLNGALVSGSPYDPLLAFETAGAQAGWFLAFGIVAAAAVAWEVANLAPQLLLHEEGVERSKARIRRLRRTLQIIFQDPYESLNPRQTVYDIVSEPLLVNHITRGRAETESRVLQALDDAGLRPPQDFLLRFPHEMSGGQRQRLSIAAALVLDPIFLVADEPVSMLDVSIRTEIVELLLELRERRGLTYLFITHDLSLAWVLADRVAVMYLGKIVEEGPTRDVVKNPLHPYTKALISVVPSADPDRRRKRTILKGERPDPAHIPPGCRFHPRCPAAFEICGWTSDEVLDDLRELAAASPPPTALDQAKILGPRSFVLPGNANETEGWLRSRIMEQAEEVRALKAIEGMDQTPEGLKVNLHAFAEPELTEVAPRIRVSCHLYDVGAAGRVAASSPLPGSH